VLREQLRDHAAISRVVIPAIVGRVSPRRPAGRGNEPCTNLARQPKTKITASRRRKAPVAMVSRSASERRRMLTDFGRNLALSGRARGRWSKVGDTGPGRRRTWWTAGARSSLARRRRKYRSAEHVFLSALTPRRLVVLLKVQSADHPQLYDADGTSTKCQPQNLPAVPTLTSPDECATGSFFAELRLWRRTLIFVWLVIGVIAGFVAAKLMRLEAANYIGAIVLGVGGALVGGWLLPGELNEFDFFSAGAALLLAGYFVVHSRSDGV
jgi:uncharacterized membrane protein YeaQ/YmgE (transglycosylase-associated protein family)